MVVHRDLRAGAALVAWAGCAIACGAAAHDGDARDAEPPDASVPSRDAAAQSDAAPPGGDLDASAPPGIDAGPITDCRTGDPWANGGCDWTCNSLSLARFKATALYWGYGNDPPFWQEVQAALGDAFAGNQWALLIDLDARAQVPPYADFRVGLGSCDDETASVCTIDDERASGLAVLDPEWANFFIPEQRDDYASRFDLDLPVRSDALGEVTIPLRSVWMDGNLYDEGNCIGYYTDKWEVPRWQHNGGVVTVVPVPAAKATWIGGDYQDTLCNLLARSDCEAVAPEEWADPPLDWDGNGDPAWSVGFGLAAIGVRITN